MLKKLNFLRFNNLRARAFTACALGTAFGAALGVASGCAGPSTPLGAVWAVHPSQVNAPRLALIASVVKESPSVQFFPSRQVLHSPTSLTLVIHDPAGFHGVKPLSHLTIRHNGLDISPSFLLQANVRVARHRLYLRLPVLRLDPARGHVIEVLYGVSGHHAYARLRPPSCDAGVDHAVHSTGVFSPAPALLRQIHERAREKHFNPAFVAALIAQESGFDSRRMTSVQAVVTALEALSTRWATKENSELLMRVYGEEEHKEALTRVVLASYHSGYSRVWSALNRYEYSWATAPDLGEARKYVGRVISYCEHFAEPEPVVKAEEIPELYHENET